MRKLNVKLLACLVAAAALLGAGAHFLHGYQLRRSASAFLKQADQAEQAGRPDEAAKHLGRYLAYNPGDIDALARYGLALHQSGESPATCQDVQNVFERVLRAQPQRHDLRRKLIHVAMSLGQFSEAKEHLDTLRKTFPADAELDRLLGECHEDAGNYALARECYEKAVEHDPAQVPAYQLLARVLNARLNDAKKADEVMQALVQANGQSFQAHLARAQYFLARAGQQGEGGPAGGSEEAAGSLAGVSQELARALERAPGEAELLFTAARPALVRAGRAGPDKAAPLFDEARAHLEKGIRLFPQRGAMYRALADVELQAGRPQEAVRCLDRAVAALPPEGPEQEEFAWALADLLSGEAGRDEAGRKKAAALVDRLRKTDYPPARLDYLDARRLVNEAKWLEAANALERLRPRLATSPGLADLQR